MDLLLMSAVLFGITVVGRALVLFLHSRATRRRELISAANDHVTVTSPAGPGVSGPLRATIAESSLE